MPDIQLHGKMIIRGSLRAETGLHIGGSQERVEIGGVDHIVIKDPEGKPYIPGSSLKGKMRSLLEIEKGLAVDRERVETRTGETIISMHLCNRPDCSVCLLFGRHNDRFLPRPERVWRECSLVGRTEDKKCPEGRTDVNTHACKFLCINNTTPTRLLVRDAYLVPKSITQEMKDNLANEWTEEKMENSIDRITSAANPRTLERVPKGARFKLEVVFTLLTEKDLHHFSDIILAMRLLEDDYLGAWGSRGSGQVCFEDLKVFWNSRQDYSNGEIDLNQKPPFLEVSNLKGLQEQEKAVSAAQNEESYAS